MGLFVLFECCLNTVVQAGIVLSASMGSAPGEHSRQGFLRGKNWKRTYPEHFPADLTAAHASSFCLAEAFVLSLSVLRWTFTIAILLKY